MIVVDTHIIIWNALKPEMLSQKAEKAISFLETALENHLYNRDILYALTTINLEQQNLETAKAYAEKLVEYYPEDQNYRQVLQHLEN